MATFGQVFGGVKEAEFPTASEDSSGETDDDTDSGDCGAASDTERMKLLYGGAQGVFQTGTEAQYPQHAGSPRATASVGPSGELKRKAPPDDSADGRSPKKSGAPAKRGKHEDQSRAKMAMLEEYITMIKQVSSRVQKVRHRRDQMNRQKEKELPGRLKDLAGYKTTRDPKIGKSADTKVSYAERKKLEKIEAKQQKEVEKLMLKAERERIRALEREQKREQKEALKDAAAAKRKEMLEQKKIEREKAKEEEKERRKAERENEKARKEVEEARIWAERQAQPDDLELPFDPARVPPAPTPFDWISRDSPLLTRWIETGDPANLLSDATGDILSLLEFIQHFRGYFVDTSLGGWGVPNLTLQNLQAVLFGGGGAELEAAFQLHVTLMRPLMTEDRQNKVWCTDWLEERNCPLDIVRFPTLLRILLETHAYFYTAYPDVVERMARLDYCDLPPPDRLAILLFLRDELLNTPTLRKRYEDSAQAIRACHAEILQLQQMAKAAKGDKVPGLCLELVMVVREQRDVDGRVLAPTFENIPTPEELPDYRSIIMQPISLAEIDQRIAEVWYKSVDECMADIQLMFNNAMTYNAPGTWVYGDAVQMLEAATEKVQALRMRESVIRQQELTPGQFEVNTRTAFDDQIDIVNAKIGKVHRSVRSCILGRDRYHNQYFLLDELPGLHVRRNTGLTAGLADDLEFSYPKPEDGGSKEQTAEEKTLEEQHYAANPVKSAWGIYSADEDFVKLEASLDVRGDREAHLKESFAEHRVAIVEALRLAREQPFEYPPSPYLSEDSAKSHLANLIRVQLTSMEHVWLTTGTTMQLGWTAPAPALPEKPTFCVDGGPPVVPSAAPPPPAEGEETPSSWDIGGEKDEDTSGKHPAMPGYYYNFVRRKYVRRSKKKMAAEKKAAEKKAAELAAAAALNGEATSDSTAEAASAGAEASSAGSAVPMETEAVHKADTESAPMETDTAAPTSAEATSTPSGASAVAPKATAVAPEPPVEPPAPVEPVVLVDPVGPGWRQRLTSASSVEELSALLRTLIENLGPRALKLTWEKPVDWKTFYAETVTACTSYALLGTYASIIDRCVMEKAKRIGERERTMKKITKVPGQ
eukprot:m.454071 g.454071  ORF g.454071 m.454071 type:complete len:1103 (+) comp20611_c0_seq1:222-3530(+)